MNPDNSFDDFLAKHLQQERAYLPDDGFAGRVIGALPAQRNISRRTEMLIISMSVLATGLLVFILFPWADTLNTIWHMALQVGPLAWLKLGMGTAASMLIAGIVWFWQSAESF